MCDHTTMRIAFVVPYFYPALGYGGTPRLAYEMALAIRKRGCEISVFTTDSVGPDRIPGQAIENIEREGLDGVQVRYYRNLSNALAYRQRVFLPIRFFRDAESLLAKYDVVHVHDLRSFLAVVAHRAAHRLGIPYVLSPHGGLPHLGKEAAKTIFDRLWGRTILRDAAAICAISRLEEADAKRLGIESRRICTFPAAINPVDYQDLPVRGAFASQFGIQNRRIALFLGRLHWVKGADVLIEAVSRLTELNDLQVVLAGPDDGAGNQLRALVKAKGLEDKVMFVGFLDQKQKLSALVDSDIVVIPSRREGFPLSLLEAFACEKPVVLTSACDLGVPIEGQRALLRFTSEDPEDLAQNIKTALCFPPDSETRRDARNLVFDQFSVDALAARALSLYESL